MLKFKPKYLKEKDNVVQFKFFLFMNIKHLPFVTVIIVMIKKHKARKEFYSVIYFINRYGILSYCPYIKGEIVNTSMHIIRRKPSCRFMVHW